MQKYLAASPCSTQSAEQIRELKREFKGFELMKVELLQILNLRPKSAVELLLVNADDYYYYHRIYATGKSNNKDYGLIYNEEKRNDL